MHIMRYSKKRKTVAVDAAVGTERSDRLALDAPSHATAPDIQPGRGTLPPYGVMTLGTCAQGENVCWEALPSTRTIRRRHDIDVARLALRRE